MLSQKKRHLCSREASLALFTAAVFRYVDIPPREGSNSLEGQNYLGQLHNGPGIKSFLGDGPRTEGTVTKTKTCTGDLLLSLCRRKPKNCFELPAGFPPPRQEPADYERIQFKNCLPHPVWAPKGGVLVTWAAEASDLTQKGRDLFTEGIMSLFT